PVASMESLTAVPARGRLRNCCWLAVPESSARRLAVGRDLRLELIEAAELHLRPDELDQRHAQGLAVEVACEVEQVDLEILLELAEGRAAAEVGDGRAPLLAVLAVDQGAHGVDAEARAQVLAQRDVGGGKADGAAALVA